MSRIIPWMFLSLYLFVVPTSAFGYLLAVCNVPVANAFNECLGKKFPNATPEQIRKLYNEVLATNVNNGDFSRIHQFVLHEMVEVIDETPHELIIRALDHFTQNKPDEKIYNTYAVHRDDFSDLRTIEGRSKLPIPYAWKDARSYEETGNIFTLSKPFTKPQTTTTFSIGTRFLVETKGTDIVHVFVLNNGAMEYMCIPVEYGVINTPRSLEEKKDCIVAQFLNASGIPTAWGGKSTTKLFKDDEYEKTTLTLPDGKVIEGFNRSQPEGHLQSGCTMAELNMMFNNMCGAPFFIKNTTTLFRLGKDTELQDLDYIAAKGYMGRVVSVKDNLVGDMRSYTHHRGAFQCVKLEKNFKDITTYQDLVDAYRSRKPLELWNKDQSAVITTFKPGDWALIRFEPEYDQRYWSLYAKNYDNR